MKFRLPLLLFAFIVAPLSSRADITLTFTELPELEIVIFSYEGSIDTSGFTPGDATGIGGYLAPNFSAFVFAEFDGSPGGPFKTQDFGSTGLPVFGADVITTCNTFHGDHFGITDTVIAYPAGYISGSPLSGVMVFDAATFESLGIDRSLVQFTATLANGDKITSRVVEKTDKSALVAALRKQGSLKRKIKKLGKKLRAARRN